MTTPPPLCPRCGSPIDGVSNGHGSTKRKRRALPNGSTGYCMTCHIGLRKVDDSWVGERG